jgi:hypothetical protein
MEELAVGQSLPHCRLWGSYAIGRTAWLTGLTASRLESFQGKRRESPVNSGAKLPYMRKIEFFCLGIPEDSLILGLNSGAEAPLFFPAFHYI